MEVLSGATLNNGVFTVPKDVYSVNGGAFGGIEGLTTIDFSKFKISEFGAYQFEEFIGDTILIKKNSKLALYLNNADTIYGDDKTFSVQYVK